jgi:serine protease AprX
LTARLHDDPNVLYPALLIIILLAGTIQLPALAQATSRASSSAPPDSLTRIILPLTSLALEPGLLSKGCLTIHRLLDSLALACPRTTSNKLLHESLAVEDKLVQIFDLESDAYIDAVESWSLGFNGTSVRVAVLDTGVDRTHPEIADSILQSADFAPGPNVDTIGHGTHVIGIITANGGQQVTGGSTNNLADPNQATGAAHQANILSARVCSTQGCRTSDIEAGIEWAVQQGARVINMSLGGGNYPGHCDQDRLAAKANWAVAQGVVVVASSGNDASTVSSPACGSSVIAVGAVYQRDIGPQDYSPTCIDETTAQDQIVCFSNTGTALDLVAPGAGILSTYSCAAAGDCSRVWYAWGWGTSQAAPHVTAVAALVLGANQSLTPSEVKTVFEMTSRDLGPVGRDNTHGWGLVDARAAVARAAAVRNLAAQSVNSSRTIAYAGTATQPTRVSVTVKNQGGQSESFNVTAYANSTEISTQPVTDLGPGLATSLIFNWNTTNIPTGNYTLSAIATPVPGEILAYDNAMQNGIVEVRKAGDVDGDRDVDIDDLVSVFLHQFTSSLPSVYDIDNDQDVDIDDLITTFARQFT